jgi:hypothetical protein
MARATSASDAAMNCETCSAVNVATDEKPQTIVRLIAEREKALRDVEARLAALAAAPGALNLETRRLEKEARRRLADFRALLDRNRQEARVDLDALLEGPLSFAPVQTPEGACLARRRKK